MVGSRSMVCKGVTLLLAVCMVAFLWPMTPGLGAEEAQAGTDEGLVKGSAGSEQEGLGTGQTPEETPEEPSKTVLDDLAVGSLAFRIDENIQEAHGRAAVEAAIKEHPGFDQADIKDSEEGILGSFSWEGYPLSFASAAATGFSVDISFTLSEGLSKKYELADPPSQIWVEPISSCQAPEGLLSQGAGKDSWTNAETITASYPGWKLAKQVDGPFQDSVTMNSAEGSYSDGVLYALDGDGVVTKVIDISYNIDRTAPVITAFSVEGEHRDEGPFWFFKTSARVTVSVVDPSAPEHSREAPRPTDQMPQSKVAGLSERDARIEYRDSVSGQTHVKDGITISGEDNEQGIMEFVLDGDQDTAVDSYRAYVEDKAGNKADPAMAGAKEIPPEVMALVTDATAPQLSVTFDGEAIPEGGYLSEGCTATFKVTEPHFRYIKDYDPDQAIASITEDDQTHVYKAKDFQRGEDGDWYAFYDLFADAHYNIRAQVTDLVGRSSELFFTEFTMDRTAPVVSVTFDNDDAQNGIYYQAPRTATISVRERNFSAALISIQPVAQADKGTDAAPPHLSPWTSEGEDHICTVFFSGPGIYSMVVEGADMAGNPLPPVNVPEFIIDSEAPQVTVQVGGDLDASRHAYRGPCEVAVTIADVHIDPGSTTEIQPVGMGSAANPYQLVSSLSETELFLFGESPATEPEHDDIYQIEVHAQDMAGNVTTKTIAWSVNRFGSTYALDDETRAMVDQGYLRSEEVQDIRITEVNPSGIDEDGVMVSLAKGPTNRTLMQGADYFLAAKGASGWPAYEYVIPKSTFAADGPYQVTLHSTDEAGNASMNTLNGKSADRVEPLEVRFAVDDTAPLISFSGCAERAYPDSFHEVGFDVEDNGKLHHARVLVNGQEEKMLDAEALADPDERKIIIYEDAHDQVVTVEAYDWAGNREIQDSPALFVNPDPWIRWTADPFLMSWAILGAIASGMTVLFLGWLRTRKKE